MINRGILKKWEFWFLVGVFVFSFLIHFYTLPAGLFWDEGRYTSFGQELMEHPLDYSTKYLEGGGPITLYSPLLPYLLMVSQFVLGAGELLSVQIVNVLLGALSCVVIFFLGKWLYNEKVGIISAMLLSVSPIFWFYSNRCLLEMPLTFFMLLAMALFWKGFELEKTKSVIASGASTTLAYLSRVSGALLLPIQALYLLITRGIKTTIKDKKVWLFLATAVLVGVPWFIRNLMLCGSISCGALQSGASIITGTHGGVPFEFYLFGWANQFPTLLNLWIAVFFVIGLMLIVLNVGQKKKEAKSDIFLLLWLLVMFVAISQQYGSAQMDYRHIVMLIPPMILVGSVAVWKISNMFEKWKFIPLIVILIVVAPLMYFSGMQGYNTVMAGQGSFASLDSAGRYIANNYPEGSKILVGSPNQVAFFAGPTKYNISHMWWMKEPNQSLSSFLKEHDFSAIVVDGYEALQPQFVFDHEGMNSLPYLEWESAFYHKGQTVAILYHVKKGTLARVIE